jgi:DNA polymerase III delta prime subunit
MENYSINQMKKVIKKLEKINIVAEKEILNMKVIELHKLKEQDKISMKDIEIIWKIQDMIQDKSWFKILFNTK